MTEKTSTSVLICGAGAAGLALAIDLARRGVSFRLIEKLDTPFPGSRGKGVQPRTQEVFEDFGIADRVIATGGYYPWRRQYASDGSYEDSQMMEDPGATPSEPYHTTILIPQFATERVMRERLAELGHKPIFGTELVGFEQDETGVTARLVQGGREQEIRCDWLIGSDGGRSFIRKTLGIDFPGKTLGVRALVADVEMEGISRDFWHIFNQGMENVMLCPLMGTNLFQLQGPLPDEGEIDLTVKGLDRLVKDRVGREDIHVREVSWASAYRMNARLADTYQEGRVFLVGDAAHAHPPTGAQGLNTSVQDAYNLGWKLSAVINGAPRDLVRTYEEERRPIAAGMLGLSAKLLEAQKKGDSNRGREVHQFGLGYTDSSLSKRAPGQGRRLEPGDRAPDAPICGKGGQRLRLFNLFSGPHWTLIGFEVGLDAVGARPGLHVHIFGPRGDFSGDLIDDEGHFEKAYGPQSGEWILVRPDGYIGGRFAPADREALEAYLTSVGVSAD